ncbi:MAG: recombinase family protein [Rickettsiales bacterium]|nr:recombinase family protein [Rickettsiales bacterium]
MKIGYVRVSKSDQDHQRQLDNLQTICDELHIETVSAVDKKRPVYEAVIAKLQAGDTLVVWDLDRAFRSTIDALLVAEKLRNRSIEFHIVTLNVDTSTPSGELVYTVMAAFAQYERKNLIKRTKEGMEAARRRGKRMGRPPKLTPKQIQNAACDVEAGHTTITARAKQLGVCRDTLGKAIAKG